MRLMALSLLGLIASSGVVFADTCDRFKTPEQVLGGLGSDDLTTKLSAKTCGVASADPAVRGIVLQQLIENIGTMSFNLDAQPKDTVGAQVINQMPQFVVTPITWSKDGRTFSGGSSVGAVYGQFLGESLGITFTGVSIQAVKAGDPATNTSCSATLSLPQNGIQLQGMLRCTGLTTRFIISLGI